MDGLSDGLVDWVFFQKTFLGIYKGSTVEWQAVYTVFKSGTSGLANSVQENDLSGHSLIKDV
jgi:hypothetical protein